jgi:predicted  nucleic acid-binding Zn-ribbon protein
MTGVCWDITERKRAEIEVRQRGEELRAANEELTRFNRVTVGRELRIIELKKQVNDLCARLGQPPRFKLELDEGAKPAKS